MNENTDAVYSCLDEKAYMKDKSGKNQTLKPPKTTSAQEKVDKRKPIFQK